MNLKNVLKTYSLLRSLNDDESALLETLRSLNDSEREQLVETMTPVKAATKKPRKKREAKSAHQQSLSSAIQRAGKVKVDAADDNDDDGFCAACHVQIGHNVHHLESLPDYHPFQSKSDVRNAGGRSSANGAGSSTTASSEVGKESVSTATGG